jgi:hypothetical protein
MVFNCIYVTFNIRMSLTDIEKELHREAFEKFVKQKYTDRGTSYVLNLEDVEEKKQLLLTQNFKDPQQRFYFNKKNFELHNDTLCQRIDGTLKEVAYLEKFFDIIYSIHSNKTAHKGINRTLDDINEKYTGIPRDNVMIFIKHCNTCSFRTPKYSQPRSKPIVSNSAFERVMIDTVDMRHKPDGEYTWIAHCMDHNSHFHVLWPMKQKTAEEIVIGFRDKWVSYFGLPKILQTDDALEFKNDLMIDLINSWDGECNCPYDGPGPLIKQENITMERILMNSLVKFNTATWTKLIPTVQYSLNISESSSLKFSPFESLLSVKPNKRKINEVVTINNTEAKIIVICNCNGKCTNKSNCKCFKNGTSCSSYCHLKSRKLTCTNKN